jgi:sodium/potassium-transporting ATPase subunit alpha
VAQQINFANNKFGKLGDRVLGFARLKLDPAVYKKDYPFDVKKWKFWKDENAPGWFPMNNFQLVGLVSMNDPPRPFVDISVLKCRQAGIKVIMVTGDQTSTAAAVAHKVNIITKPELEYNYLLEHNPGMTKYEAFEKC